MRSSSNPAGVVCTLLAPPEVVPQVLVASEVREHRAYLSRSHASVRLHHNLMKRIECCYCFSIVTQVLLMRIWKSLIDTCLFIKGGSGSLCLKALPYFSTIKSIGTVILIALAISQAHLTLASTSKSQYACFSEFLSVAIEPRNHGI